MTVSTSVADPDKDPAFYLNTDPDPDTDRDPDPGFSHDQKFTKIYSWKKIDIFGTNCNYLSLGLQKATGEHPALQNIEFLNFLCFSCFLANFFLPGLDPDPQHWYLLWLSFCMVLYGVCIGTLVSSMTSLSFFMVLYSVCTARFVRV